MKILTWVFGGLITIALLSCGSDDSTNSVIECTPLSEIQLGPDIIALEPSNINDRGACDETLPFTPSVSISTNATQRIVTTNSIPDHMVGLFGMAPGALNPNAIGPVNSTYTLSLNPSISASPTALQNNGPAYEFGVLLNGVVLDPIAAEPWPHEGITSPDVNWDWNLDAMVIDLGLDCNNAHVQPTGKYHHHGPPSLFIESLSAPTNEMTLIGYAADGFPIYYKYGYQNANDSNSPVIVLESGYALKTGERPGDGESAPCGEYNGVYTNDWEWSDSGDLDECNGRSGVTPEFPGGTYYYIISDTDYPYIPRCLVGTPSNDFAF